MKKTAITAIILTLFFTLASTASAQYETGTAAQTETSMAESTRRTIAAPSDYAPEPQEEVVTEYRTPEGLQGTGLNKNPEHYYHQLGYPEYLSYIGAYDKFLTEGDVLVVQFRAGLTDMSQENINEVLSIMDSSCWVVFEQASYSYNQRYEIYNQLLIEFYDCYISLGYETEDIHIAAPVGKTEEIIARLDGRFEGLVSVADHEGYLYDGAGQMTGERISVPEAGLGGDTGSPVVLIGVDNSGPILLIFIIASLLLIAGAAFLLLAYHRIRINSDGSAAAEAVLTIKDVKQLVSHSAEAPRSELRERILK